MVEDDLERAWDLPPDATALDRLLAWKPQTPAGYRFRNMLIARLCREQGLPLPWAAHRNDPTQA
jgi:hypothetical protein